MYREDASHLLCMVAEEGMNAVAIGRCLATENGELVGIRTMKLNCQLANASIMTEAAFML